MSRQYELLSAFAGELLGQGLTTLVLSPGSRSTPIALTFSHLPFSLYMALDERSAGFFALGLARATGQPVALACTSGSAAANYLPAVVEASEAHVPLIVLTADRPAELRDTGSAQTIAQRGIYASFARWCAELPGDLPGEGGLHFARRTAARAYRMALEGPMGPVHVNLPLREPLLPDAGFTFAGPAPRPVEIETLRPRRTVHGDMLSRAADRLREGRRVLLFAGPGTAPGPLRELRELAQRLGAPLLADPLSQQRTAGAIDAYDALLRDARIAEALAPDVVLRLGGAATSKPLAQWLSRLPGRQIVLSGESEWADPLGVPSLHLHGDVETTVQLLLERLPQQPHDAYADLWKRLQTAARQAIDGFLGRLGEPFDGAALRAAADALTVEDLLFVGSSMPVRDLDSFSAGIAPRVLSNRGANGIDGVVSTALGAALGHPGRTLLAIGDLSFHHDIGGLLLARLHDIRLTILLLNNDGGGIFSFLPQAGVPAFERLFGTPHGLDFRHAAALYGGRFFRPDHRELPTVLAEALDAHGLSIVELCTERGRNRELHAEAFRSAIGAALRELGAKADA